MENAVFGSRWLESMELPLSGGGWIVCSCTTADGTVIERKCDESMLALMPVRRLRSL